MIPRLRILLVMEQCNPDWASVPLLAWRLYDALRRRDDVAVTLVTHARNRHAVEARREDWPVIYVSEPAWIARYYRAVECLLGKGGVNWPLLHALSYPIYLAFDHAVRQHFSMAVRKGEYDVVHAMTPILPRYPVALAKDCGGTPFLLGPVNGGLPFPPGFGDAAKREHAAFNLLRNVGRLLPGYKSTYRSADRVLAGSLYTKSYVEVVLGVPNTRTALFHENGVPASFIRNSPHPRPADTPLEALFVGRLTPYKGADIAIRAVAAARKAGASVRLTIVGDGAIRNELEAEAAAQGIAEAVTFTGWIPQEATRTHYHRAHVFLFPSIREFGGGVALEAMAAGVPVICPAYGGLDEYLTPETGIKLPLSSPAQLEAACTTALLRLEHDDTARQIMAQAALARASHYTWEARAALLKTHYTDLADSTRVRL